MTRPSAVPGRTARRRERPRRPSRHGPPRRDRSSPPRTASHHPRLSTCEHSGSSRLSFHLRHRSRPYWLVLELGGGLLAVVDGGTSLRLGVAALGEVLGPEQRAGRRLRLQAGLVNELIL